MKHTARILFSLFAILYSTTLLADIRLPAMVSDSMVLQRDAKLKIWGWADAHENIKLTFNRKRYSTKAGSDGKWLIWLPATAAGGPYTMHITGDRSTITLNGIMMGDVWLCAGQSNMVHQLELHKDRYQQEIAAANYPHIRQFTVPTKALLVAPDQMLTQGAWKPATSKNILQFSVVAYFFAKNLYDQYRVPIGIINASVGGTPIEAWISEEGLLDITDVHRIVKQNKDTAYVNAINRTAALKNQAISKSRPSDKGLTGSVKWFDPAYQPKDWNTIAVPGYWEDQGVRDLNGVVWYRKEIEIPKSMTGLPVRLSLGRMVDADEVYVNGVLVGNKTYQYPQRRYDLGATVLKSGKNTIVVRITNYAGKGGFVPDKPYYLATKNDTLNLTGYWQYNVGAVYSAPTGDANGIAAQNQPTALYNGMIAPFTNYSIKGILWYQGESNTGKAQAYDVLLPALIHDWRRQWAQLNLPFLYAQLPNFMEVDYAPSESQWARLREAQLKALRINNTAMTVTIDLGEWNDIHPGNKKPIGDRLALAARNMVYQEKNLVYSGPLFTSSNVTDHKVTLTFHHVGSGLISKDGEALRWFAVAGEDKKFVWANASIENNTVVVWSDAVVHPVYVRYAWADNPANVNFYNRDGLPASPFQAQVAATDKLWRGKKAAVVLTYDDALAGHLDTVIPSLDALGLKGTFYLSADYPGSKNRIQDWRNAARKGHELGNHTLFHPCDASKPGRDWVAPQNDLSKYTTEKMVQELDMTNAFLESIDGKKQRTFAYTCGDMHTGEGSFVEAIKHQFVAMRGVDAKLNTLATLDLTNINCYVVDDTNVDQLITWAEKARDENALLVLLFHGVGGGHSINVDAQKHHDFLTYLKNHPDDYWVTTMLEASLHSMEQLKK
jgi:sialate O-acetylesterase